MGRRPANIDLRSSTTYLPYTEELGWATGHPCLSAAGTTHGQAGEGEAAGQRGGGLEAHGARGTGRWEEARGEGGECS